MEKKKASWTWIDTIIVIIVAAVLVVAGKILGPMLFEGTDKEKVSFTVMLQEKEDELAQAMKAGDKVTLSLTEKDGGIIKEVRVEPSEKLTLNSIDGKYSMEPVANKVDIYVTVEADCTISDKAIKTGDTAIKVGTDIPVRGKGYASSGYIITIDE